MWYIKETMSNEYVYKCFADYCITTNDLNQAIGFDKLLDAEKMAEMLQKEHDTKWSHYPKKGSKKIFKTISVG